MLSILNNLLEKAVTSYIIGGKNVNPLKLILPTNITVFTHIVMRKRG